jgi:hypothetical protein
MKASAACVCPIPLGLAAAQRYESAFPLSGCKNGKYSSLLLHMLYVTCLTLSPGCLLYTLKVYLKYISPRVTSVHVCAALILTACVLLWLFLPMRSCSRGEGMPISRQPGQRGNLIIKFDVTFPRQLSSSQKEQIRSLLPTGL